MGVWGTSGLTGQGCLGQFLASSLANLSFRRMFLHAQASLHSPKTSLLRCFKLLLTALQSYSLYFACSSLLSESAILWRSSFCSLTQLLQCSCSLRLDSLLWMSEAANLQKVCLFSRVWVWLAKHWKSRPAPLRCSALSCSRFYLLWLDSQRSQSSAGRCLRKVSPNSLTLTLLGSLTADLLLILLEYYIEGSGERRKGSNAVGCQHCACFMSLVAACYMLWALPWKRSERYGAGICQSAC